MVTYKDAGVDVGLADAFVERLRTIAPDIGGFGGLFPLGNQYLVAGTDGVGTKLKIATEMGQHDSIGIDLVAMSVNDIATTGAKPLFFLDYFSTSRLDPNVAEAVVQGIAVGCSEAGCVLLGGETAEMPDFYQDGDYDLCGFAVGIVDKDALIDKSSVSQGDVLVGIASSGFHSNGYSLIRSVLRSQNIDLDSRPFETVDVTVGELLLNPTRIYSQQLLEWNERYSIKSAAHITGGGIEGNVPRAIPEGLHARVRARSWAVPEHFNWLRRVGDIPETEMRRTFNIGMGLVLVMPGDDAEAFVRNEEGWIIGDVVSGEGGVQWI